MSKVFSRIYPEFGAGGYHRHNGRVAFFSRIRAILPEQPHVLDFGAGRGRFSEYEAPGVRRITNLAPDCARFAAFDVDEAVLENVETEDRHFAPIGEPLPFADDSFDLIFAWMVFEHVADPGFYASEMERILRPGGWVCACTPNKWGVIGMGTRLLPNSLHTAFLSVLSPQRKEKDTFPTTYYLNTRADVRRHFKPARFNDHSFFVFSGPAYYANRTWLAKFWIAINWLTPPAMKQSFQIFLQKRTDT